ncbi:MAG TPA: preprotein translocase subunit SecG [Pedomonas sp.]|nr:preprotein translocase subunit SecG [Pedomonas sp.]
MMTFLLVVHSLIAVAMVTVILLQRSEGGALGIGGGGGGGGLMSARGAANLLTRATAILAALFIVTSIGLAFLAKVQKTSPSEIDRLLQEDAAVTAPAVPGEAAPAVPTEALPALPSVPVGD